MERFTVYCNGAPPSRYGGRPECHWKGRRRAESFAAAGEKTCPKCGGAVQVLPKRRAR